MKASENKLPVKENSFKEIIESKNKKMTKEEFAEFKKSIASYIDYGKLKEGVAK